MTNRTAMVLQFWCTYLPDFEKCNTLSRMNSTYRFEKSFGPTASFDGIILLVAGLVTTYFSLNGIVLLVVGAFMAFTDSSTTIDPANKRVRFTNNIFGIIRIGKWINVERDMKINLILPSRHS